MIGAIAHTFQNYGNFSGRASRSGYWFWVLFVFVASSLLMLVDIFFGTYSYEVEGGLFSGIFGLAVFIPSIAVGVRRLHDTGYSGWWMLLVLFPFIGLFALVVWFCIPSNKGGNKYGPEPQYFGLS